MQRVLEVEWMDSPGEAIAYDQMDHAGVNRLFVDDLLAALGRLVVLGCKKPEGSTDRLTVLDLGTGTAQIPMELARRDARFEIVAVDAAPSMIELATSNVAAARLESQITLRSVDAKRLPAEMGLFEVVMSNSLVHHLPEPRVFFEQASKVVTPGGLVLVRDLLRPATEEEWEGLVARYAADAEPEQRQMFGDSLRAALTIGEVRQFVEEQGCPAEGVEQTSNRHWTWNWPS